MKKMMMVLMMAFTMVTGLFAEERKWNVEYRIRRVTTDEFCTFIKTNPRSQEYDWWIDEDNDTLVDYMDPYWDNDVVKTAMQKILQEAEPIKKEIKKESENDIVFASNDKVYAFVEISYGDSSIDRINTIRVFIRDLNTYEMREFTF